MSDRFMRVGFWFPYSFGVIHAATWRTLHSADMWSKIAGEGKRLTATSSSAEFNVLLVNVMGGDPREYFRVRRPIHEPGLIVYYVNQGEAYDTQQIVLAFEVCSTVKGGKEGTQLIVSSFPFWDYLPEESFEESLERLSEPVTAVNPRLKVIIDEFQLWCPMGKASRFTPQGLPAGTLEEVRPQPPRGRKPDPTYDKAYQMIKEGASARKVFQTFVDNGELDGDSWEAFEQAINRRKRDADEKTK